MNVRSAATVLVTAASFALGACSGGDAPQREASAPTTSSDSQVSASVSEKNDSGMQGHVIVSAGADAITIKLEVLGLKGGTEYPTHLHSGTCEQGGEVVTELESPTVASVGLGSSLTELSPDAMQEDQPYFVQLHLPDGTPAACADVEKPARS